MVIGVSSDLKPSSELLLTIPRLCFCRGSFLLFTFHVCLYYSVVSVPCTLVITCWLRADLLVLLCAMFPCNFITYPYGVKVVLIVLIPYLCFLLFFYFNSLIIFLELDNMESF